MKIGSLLVSATITGLTLQAAGLQVEKVQLLKDQRTGLRVVSGELELPSSGAWEVAPGQPDTQPIGQVFLRTPSVVWTALEGERMGALQDRQSLEQARRELHQLHWACRQYADQHQGRGPERLSDLDHERHRFLNEERFAERFALVPSVQLPRRTNPPQPKAASQPLAFEVRPAFDDGQHWVLWSNGRVDRQEVDPQQAEEYDLRIEPLRPTRETELAGLGERATYEVFGLWDNAQRIAARLALTNRFTGAELVCSWSTADARSGDETLLREWATLRGTEWKKINDAHPSLTLSLWLRQAETLYDLSGSGLGQSRRGPGNRTTLFNVLGGRAAIRETLQLQDLAVANDEDDPAARTVAVESIPGVKVKAHPYDELLGSHNGGRLALAELVPHDRFFCYFPRPSELVRFIDSGSDFMFHLSSGFNGRSIRYGLLDRYLGRLGLNEETMRGLLESGAMAEVGLFLPDLFLIDGTDLTVVARLDNPALARPVLRLLGLDDSTDVTVLRSLDGKPVYWVQQDEWLLISTRRSELRSALALRASAGEGSLGRSKEFRAMLMQLPLRETSRGYLYFSDPFLRRLTGPEVKIGQLRRVLARGQLEAISAGALLHQLDHPNRKAGLQSLLKAGYVPQIRSDLAEVRLGDDQQTVSTTYGTPSSMKSLLELPVDRVTPTEAGAYATYRQNYERFWRQFFDPIAVRFDQTGVDSFEVETFILPLIDSSIYAGFREGIQTAESGLVMHVPVLHPEPVAVISANLTESTWVEFLDDIDDWLIRFLGLRSGLLDQLGPSLHLALADGDPIINTGSGDLLGSFSAGGLRMDNEMFTIPAIVALLTRPSSLLVEVKDREIVRHALRQLPTGDLPRQGGFFAFNSALTQVDGRDEWIYSLSIGGMLKLRYGIGLQEDYLVISNLPLTHRPTIQGARKAAHNGMCLRLAPRAAELLLPSLFAATVENQRHAALEGLGMLYPLVECGIDGPTQASALHEHLFGFAPLHPPGGRFQVENGTLTSSRFGHPGKVRQPAYAAGDRDFGVMRQIDALELSIQFERDGLRAQCNWVTR